MSLKRQIITYALAYVMLTFSVLFGALVLSISRDTVLFAMVYAVKDETQREQFYQNLRIGAVSQWSYVVIGLIVIILLVALEHVYRTGVPDGSVWKKFFLVTGTECGVLSISHAVSFILRSDIAAQSWLSIALPIVEAMLTGLFFWLAFNLHRITSRTGQRITT